MGEYSFTSSCFFVGLRYCPTVNISTPAFLRSLIVFSTSSSVSPSPTMMDDLVITSFLHSFIYFRTERVWSYPALGSRTDGVSLRTVSMLCAITSGFEAIILSRFTWSPPKSGIKTSIFISSSFTFLITLANADDPLSGRSSLSTEVITT